MPWEVEQYGTKLDGVAANAAEASRTVEIDVADREEILFVFGLVWAAASAMTVQLYKSADGGTTYGRVESIAITAGTGTASDYTVNNAVSGNETIAVDLNVRNCTHVKAIFGATGGGASDLLTVQASAGFSI